MLAGFLSSVDTATLANSSSCSFCCTLLNLQQLGSGLKWLTLGDLTICLFIFGKAM